MDAQQKNKENKSNSNKIIAIFSLLVIIVLAGWAAFRWSPAVSETARRLTAAFVSLSQKLKPSNKIAVSADKTIINSGETVTISWTNNFNTSDGNHFISYDCIDGVSASIDTISGEETVTCDKPYNTFKALGDDSSATINITSEKETVDVNITVEFVKKGDTKTTLAGKTLINVLNPNFSTENIDPGSSDSENTEVAGGQSDVEIPIESVTHKTPITAGQKTENLYPINNPDATTAKTFGKADLAVRIIDVGNIDRTTNVFTTTSTSTMKSNGRVAFHFTVENLGTKESGQWKFNAILPSMPMNIFQSQTQQSLAPGERIEYTLGFDSAIPDQDGTIVINVDPQNLIQEVTKDNNIARLVIHPRR